MRANALLAAAAAAALFGASGFQTEIAEWRRAREAALRRDDGWLTVTGLFWLKEGVNRFGRDASNDIALADGAARAGAFTLKNGKVAVESGGARREVRFDSDDFVAAGRLKLFVIKRGERIGVRVKDPRSESLLAFQGLQYFPARESWRIAAKFVAEPRKLPITNVLGQTEPSDSPGYAVFQVQGKEVRLYPVLDAPDAKELFYIFRDLTAGRETYGGGRFLYSNLPHNGEVILDFNKAYNPPCVFTPYATCPLPPKENRLPVRIEAGEKKYK